MISYVLLVSMVLVLSVGVFSWLKLAADVKPEPDCKDDTSIIITDYACDPDSTVQNFKLTLKNNGRFNIDGIILTVGDDADKAPSIYLIPEFLGGGGEGGTIPGHYFFNDPLKPGVVLENVDFLDKTSGTESIDFTNIEIIEVQPFIVKEGERILCQEAVIKQKIEACQISPTPPPII